jgi:hypothetical protein
MISGYLQLQQGKVSPDEEMFLEYTECEVLRGIYFPFVSLK